MKILHLIPFLSGGGAERQLQYLAPELARMGHDVHIGFTNEGPEKIDLTNVKLHKINIKSNYDPFLLFKLIKLIRKIKPDVIQTWILQLDILGGIAAEITATPWVLREPSSAKSYQRNLKTLMRSLIGSRADAVISNSYGGDDCWKKKLSDSKRHVIRNALPIDKIENTPPNLADNLISDNAPVILFVGRIIEYKGIKKLLDALALLKNNHKFQAFICGDGPDLAELQEYAYNLDLNNFVEFTGHLETDQTYAMMKRSAIFVSLSNFEGCPNSVMEAAACGCRFVLSDIPAHRELLGDCCRHYVNTSDINRLSYALTQSLDDDNTGKSYTLAVKQKALEWSIPEMARNFEKVYKDVV